MRFTKAQREQALKINMKIRMAGSSQAKIARMLGKTQQAVWNVVWGAESKAIKNAIAKIVGERVEDLWSDEDEEERAA